MKLLLAVCNDKIAAGLVENMVKKGFRVTRLPSTGGFLRQGSTTIISGMEDDEIQLALQIIKDYSEKKKIEQIEELQHRAKNINEKLVTLFILPVEKTIQL